MSDSISISDFLVAEKTLWKLYRLSPESPTEFRGIRQQLFSLHVVFYQLSEDTGTHESFFVKVRQESPTYLTMAFNGCKYRLAELEKLLDEYKQLERKAVKEQLEDLCSKISSHTQTLTGLLLGLGNSTLPRIEKIGFEAFERLERKIDGRFLRKQTGNSLSVFLSQTQGLNQEREEFAKIVAAEGVSSEALATSQDFIQAFIEKVAEDGISKTLGPIPTTNTARDQVKRDSGEPNIPGYDLKAYINEKRGDIPEERIPEKSPEETAQPNIQYPAPPVPEPPRNENQSPVGAAASGYLTPPDGAPARRGYWESKLSEEKKLMNAKKMQFG